MTILKTEERHDKATGIDALPPADALRLLAAGQQAAAQVVDRAIEPLAEAADLAATALLDGGRLVYAGAGSSGLMAMADALELPGTYGIAPDRVIVLLAGGAASLSDLAGGYEDDVDLARADIERAGVGKGDCLVAVSASGSTLHTIVATDAARARGARVVAVANNGNAPLFSKADVAVLLETPPELVSGSTRMGAGTAQKIAFNMLSTLVGIRLGHVHDGHMVNLKADNIKLRRRALRIVCDISGVDAAEAGRCLEAAQGSVKLAVLIAAGAADAVTAADLLDGSKQNLRQALDRLRAHR